jgi:hypothetical protein
MKAGGGICRHVRLRFAEKMRQANANRSRIADLVHRAYLEVARDEVTALVAYALKLGGHADILGVSPF